ncbi:MAG: GNAT family N-acetyltransferase [bacterium]|nr:GNAT family N-acetyltransferase [bacterium]
MEIKNLTKAELGVWDDFCEQSSDAWFWHTTIWLDYCGAYKPAHLPGLSPENKSFLVRDDGKILAVCPLFVETIAGEKQISSGNIPAYFPALAPDLSLAQREKTIKFIFEHVGKLAREFGVMRAVFQAAVLAPALANKHFTPFNYLVKLGYLDSSINTQIIDLNKDEKALRADMSHGHDAAVAAGSKLFSVQVYDKANLTRQIFDQYVAWHELAGGGQVRPRKTYDLMYQAAEAGSGFLVGASQDQNLAGLVYFYTYKGNCYYASVGVAPEMDRLPIAHFIQWEAIKYMKSKNYRFYELGWQFFSPSLNYPEVQKEISISKFKRGFGGTTVPLVRGEKFFDNELLKKVLSQRAASYIKSLEEKYE